MNRRAFIKVIGVLAAVPFLPTILKPTFAEVMSGLTFRFERVVKGGTVACGGVSTRDGWLMQLWGSFQDGTEWQAVDYTSVDDIPGYAGVDLTDVKALRKLKANLYRAMYRRFVAIEKGIPEADVPR